MKTEHSLPPLALGQSDFREFRKAGAYYVDKSLLIRDVILCSYQSILLPRPRRFGKTLNLSMLRYFFEQSDDYEIRTNRESGYGRYDILLKPKDVSNQGIILEFERVFEGEQPETVLKNALQQIENRRYATELTASGVQRILRIAIAFRSKEMWLECLSE